jgi:hypothetical protein
VRERRKTKREVRKVDIRGVTAEGKGGGVDTKTGIIEDLFKYSISNIRTQTLYIAFLSGSLAVESIRVQYFFWPFLINSSMSA